MSGGRWDCFHILKLHAQCLNEYLDKSFLFVPKSSIVNDKRANRHQKACKKYIFHDG
jgi:hypothetical protein